MRTLDLTSLTSARTYLHRSLLEAAVAKRTKELEDALQVKNRFLAVVSYASRFSYSLLTPTPQA